MNSIGQVLEQGGMLSGSVFHGHANTPSIFFVGGEDTGPYTQAGA
jgi:hypothetical protein